MGQFVYSAHHGTLALSLLGCFWFDCVKLYTVVAWIWLGVVVFADPDVGRYAVGEGFALIPALSIQVFAAGADFAGHEFVQFAIIKAYNFCHFVASVRV